MFKVVLDTNVILAAYLTKGAASKIIKKWAEGAFGLLISDEIVKEYLRILLSQNIDTDLVFEFNNQLERHAEIIRPQIKLNVVKDDPDDNKFFECAAEGSAKYVVSNDQHLLQVKNYNGVKVLSIQQFLKLIE